MAFQSAATNLVSGDTNELRDVFVRDLKRGSRGVAWARVPTKTNRPFRRCLWRLVGHRRRLLNYRKKNDIERYRTIGGKQGLRG